MSPESAYLTTFQVCGLLGHCLLQKMYKLNIHTRILYFWHELCKIKLFVIYVGIKYLFKWFWYILPQVIFILIYEYDVYNYYILYLRVKNMGLKPQIRTLFWVKIKNLLSTDVSPTNELIKCSINDFVKKLHFHLIFTARHAWDNF